MTRRDLVIVRADDGSLHPRWLRDPVERSWDLVVSYFGDDPERFRDADAVRIDGKGPKWPALQALLRSRLDLLHGYEYIWLPDDDIDCRGADINRLFDEARRRRLLLAQPALTPQSYSSWDLTLQNPFTRARFTNFVEIMVPCFAREFLVRALPTFDENLSGWGLDFVWSTLTTEPCGLAIIDSVTVTHTRPIGSANYRHLAERGLSPHDEWGSLLAAHRIVDPVLRVDAIELRGGLRLDARSALGRAVVRAGYLTAAAQAYLSRHPQRSELRRRLQAALRSPTATRVYTARPAPALDGVGRRQPAQEACECQTR